MTAILHTKYHGRTSYPVAYLQFGYFWLTVGGRQVEKGGWWYVKETKNTDSTVRFNREQDEFFAPTLQEAINLYLDSIK